MFLAFSVRNLLYRSCSAISAVNHQGEGKAAVQAPKSPPAQAVEVKVTPEEDEKKERIAQGMKLLLAARDRVLTLMEQRVRGFSEYWTFMLTRACDRS